MRTDTDVMLAFLSVSILKVADEEEGGVGGRGGGAAAEFGWTRSDSG